MTPTTARAIGPSFFAFCKRSALVARIPCTRNGARVPRASDQWASRLRTRPTVLGPRPSDTEKRRGAAEPQSFAQEKCAARGRRAIKKARAGAELRPAHRCATWKAPRRAGLGAFYLWKINNCAMVLAYRGADLGHRQKENGKMKISERLAEYIALYPGLVFQNDGYQEMPRDLADTLRPQIAEIEALITPVVWGFVRFQNFKRRPDGGMVLRCQVFYDDERSFVGVSYIHLEAFDAVNVGGGLAK